MRIRGICSCAVLLSAVLALIIGMGAPASAQALPPPAPGSTVLAELHFNGSRHYGEALLAAASRLKPGDTVTEAQLQAVATYFAGLGVFYRANYTYTRRGDKLVVQFNLEDAPTVPVLFDNFPLFTDDELTAAIRHAVPLFDGTAPTDGSMLEDITSAVAALLPSRHISGTVEHMLIAHPLQDGMMMLFRLNLTGSPMTIASLEYGDAFAQDSEQLHDRNDDLTGKPFSRLAIEVFESEQVRPLYLATGHLRVKFGPPQLTFTGDPHQALSDPHVLLPVDPGPVFNILLVTATGNVALDADAIDKASTLDSGQLADGIKIAAAWQNIQQEYRRRGYLDAKIDPQAQYNDAGATVSYKLVITEGPQYRMRSLIVTGLSDEALDALRLRWDLLPGSIFDGVFADGIIAKLQKPSEEIFGALPVHYSKMGDWLRTDPQTKTVDVLLDFQ